MTYQHPCKKSLSQYNLITTIIHTHFAYSQIYGHILHNIQKMVLQKKYKNCDSRECRLSRKSSACCFAQVCRKIGNSGLVPQGFLINEASPSHSDIQHSIGLLWTSDQLVAGTSTWQHTTHKRTDIPAPGGIRTHNPNERAAADPRLRPQGHWERERNIIIKCNKVRSFTPSWFTDKHRRAINLILSTLPSYPSKWSSSL